MCFGKVGHDDDACGFSEIEAFSIGVERLAWFGGTDAECVEAVKWNFVQFVRTARDDDIADVLLQP